MEDTSPEIKQMQLKIWLAKPPEERLRIALEDNEAQFALWNELKKNLTDNNPERARKPFTGA
jgi:hypothetical protein